MRQPDVRSQQRGETFLIGGLLLAVCAYYVLQISAGKFTGWPTYTTYYDTLANGFLDGHLYTSVQPSRQLLAQPDPFDWSLQPYWYWDASLYKGHYFLYWGPVPALFAALVKLVVGKAFVVGDELLVFGFVVARLCAGTALLWVLARSPRLAPSRWGLTAAVLVFGIACPTPFVLARAAVYEAAIAGGQFFLVLGWWCSAVALTREVRKNHWFAGASICFALALGCRISLLFAVAFGVALFLLHDGVRQVRWRALAWRALALGVPLVLAACGFLLYNQLRFDDPFEFGVSYQTSTMSFLTDRRFWLANVYSYALRSPAYSCAFPWLHAPYAPQAPLPRGMGWPLNYVAYEPLVGMLRTTPLGVMLLGPPAISLWRRLRPAAPREALLGRELRVLLVAFLGASLALLPALGLWMATMRYQEDVIAGFVLAAVLCAWATLRWAATQPRWVRVLGNTIFQGTGLLTLVAGVLLGFEGYLNHYATHNPQYLRLAASLSCQW
jgi:hypothetical protein